jgi:glycosyltransferase involved in cell wall biosynthesis
MIDLSVIVPVRNAEPFITDCLKAIFEAEPYEVIVVDGLSTDRTLEIIRAYIDQGYPIKLLSDEGHGVPAARMMGIRAATMPIVALIDVDIVLPDGALAALFKEFRDGNYDGLQAGLRSESDPGYWGRALVFHHNNGRSKNWPGVMATLFKREVLLKNPFDERFRSGEDIELRWRLRGLGLHLGVSQTTIVRHRYGDTFEFAKDQFLADGKGLGRMFAKYGWGATSVLVIPLLGCVRGILVSLAHLQPVWIPYYLAYLVYNYRTMPSGMREDLKSPSVRIKSGEVVHEPRS